MWEQRPGDDSDFRMYKREEEIMISRHSQFENAPRRDASSHVCCIDVIQCIKDHAFLQFVAFTSFANPWKTVIQGPNHPLSSNYSADEELYSPSPSPNMSLIAKARKCIPTRPSNLFDLNDCIEIVDFESMLSEGEEETQSGGLLR
jgi:hypothetical protein